MKNFDLTLMGVQEMNTLEMQETDGGFFCAILIIAAVCLLTSSCVIDIDTQIGGGGSGGNTINSSDSAQNGWRADSTSVNLRLR